MTFPSGPPERRGFKSRTSSGPTTPKNRPWGFVTRHQLSGWRFLIRRIANGVALRNTEMLSDPLRRQARAAMVGVALAVIVCIGTFLMTMFKGAGAAGNHVILADHDTNALYVIVNGQAHPVPNLASARLIAGRPDEPTTVKPTEIDRYPLGNKMGIFGAPERMVQSPDKNSRWIVCDAVTGTDEGTTVIAGDPAPGPGHASSLPENSAILATSDAGATTWLIWGNKRSQIDLNNPAVAASVGITVDAPAPRPIARQLLNLIPESPPLVVPFIANAGDPPRFVWPAPGAAPAIGSVITDHENNQRRYYAVTAEGLQPISPVIAAILRANAAYGLIDPPSLTPDQIAKTPAVHAIATSNYPDAPLKILSPVDAPVTCGQWNKLAGSPTSTLGLLSGQSLPIPTGAAAVPLIDPGPMNATRVVIPRGQGYYLEVTGQQPQSTTKESLFWLSDLGVRYGMEDAEHQASKTAATLGMGAEPLPIPWAVLSLFTAGPTLSKSDALVAH